MPADDGTHRTEGISQALRAILRCPSCRGELADTSAGMACGTCGANYRVDDGVPRLVSGELGAEASYAFYNEDDVERFGREELPPEFDGPIQAFIESTPEDKLLVELGSGRGAFYESHPRYLGVDFSWVALRDHGSGPRLQASAEELPFADGSIDALFTMATLEHVPDPARALAELDRTLSPGGRLLLYPAWYVRSWAASALAVRSYSSLSWPDRLRKASIVVRDRRPYRFARVLPGRVARELRLRSGRPIPFQYRKLKPNLDGYVTTDSDAFSSLDPQAMAAYFISRGYRDVGRPTPRGRLLYGYEPVLLEKPITPGPSQLDG